MDWRHFLREERHRKLALNQLLMSGSVSIVANHVGGVTDVSASIIQENRDQIREIEALLVAEGLSFDVQL